MQNAFLGHGMQLLRFAPLAASLVACAALEEASVVRDKLHRYMGEERFDEVYDYD
jgi:hypothetical protein